MHPDVRLDRFDVRLRTALCHQRIEMEPSDVSWDANPLISRSSA
jgi:hypothetical protein